MPEKILSIIARSTSFLFLYCCCLQGALEAGYIYTASASNPAQISRMNQDGTGYTVLHQPGSALSFGSLAIDVNDEKVYFTTSNGILNKMNLDGSAVVQISTGNPTTDFDIDSASQVIFYGSVNQVRAINFDGTNDQIVIDLGAGSGEVFGIALDLPNGKIYGTRFGMNGASDIIFRLNTDGSGYETLIDFGFRVGKPPSTLADIAVDSSTGKIYWTDQYVGMIQRANIDGSNVETVISNDWGRRIAIDQANNKLYWGSVFGPNGNDGGLYRSNLDGSNRELVYGATYDFHGIGFGPLGSQSAVVPEPSGMVSFFVLAIVGFIHKVRVINRSSVTNAIIKNTVLLTIALLLSPYTFAGVVRPEMILISNQNNTNDFTGFGGVSYEYKIGKFEITNREWASFLNAVASTDTFGLYNTQMGAYYGGISRLGTSGNYVYEVVNGRDFFPVICVSWYDALRYANWLHNGCPVGLQNSASTEDGAYTILAGITLDDPIYRNPNAQWFLPNENEWYKAAYYNPSNSTYSRFATRSNSNPVPEVPVGGNNSANYGKVYGSGASGIFISEPTQVGAYVNTYSWYGTYDQTGNLAEWNESIFGSGRGFRDGSHNTYAFDVNTLSSSGRWSDYGDLENSGFGFRIASLTSPVSPVPEPSSVTVVFVASIGFLINRRLLHRNSLK